MAKETKPVALSIIGPELWMLPSVRRTIREVLGHLPSYVVQDILRSAMHALGDITSMSRSVLAKTFNRCVHEKVQALDDAGLAVSRRASASLHPDNVVTVNFKPKPTKTPPRSSKEAPASMPMPNCPAIDREKFFTTKQLAERGWARQWMSMVMGEPLMHGAALLWPKDKALNAEKHPAFSAARDNLSALAKRVRYVTKEHEARALQEAVESCDASKLPPVERIKIAPVPTPPPSEWPKVEQTDDALTLIWPEGKVIVPTPFLDALRRGMDETQERLSFAINTVVTDWRAARARPEKLQYGRNYLLASVKNVLRKLQELEGAAPQPAAQEPAEEPQQPDDRVLH